MKGFSLLELVMVLAVIGLLLGIGIPSYNVFIRRAQKAKCMSHIRTLHAGLAAFWEDKGHWPQFVDSGGKPEELENEYFQFWIRSLEPYGAAADTWLCPSDKVQGDLYRGFKSSDEVGFTGSYVVTPFDDKNNTPFKWNQPWISERGDLHGKGSLVAMPDGSIQEWQSAFMGR